MSEPPSQPAPKSPFISRLQHAMRLLGVNEWQLEQALGRVQGGEKPKKGYLSRTIAQDRSPLISTAEALADALGVQRAWLLAGSGPMLVAEAHVCAEIPGWAEAAAEARRGRRVPACAIDVVARRPAMVVPERATAEFVRDAAYLWWNHSPLAEIEAAAAAEAAGIVGAEDDPPEGTSDS